LATVYPDIKTALESYWFYLWLMIGKILVCDWYRNSSKNSLYVQGL